MTCPKCEEQTVVKIRFNKTGNAAYFCESCETVWFEGEEISKETGRLLDSAEREFEYKREETEIDNPENVPLDFAYK